MLRGKGHFLSQAGSSLTARPSTQSQPTPTNQRPSSLYICQEEVGAFGLPGPYKPERALDSLVWNFRRKEQLLQSTPTARVNGVITALSC